MQMQPKLVRAYFIILALMPVFAVFAPRMLSFYPGLAGVALFFICGRPRDLLDKRIFYPVLVLAALTLTSSLWSFDMLLTVKKAAAAVAVLLSGGLVAAFASRIPVSDIKPYVHWIAGSLIAASLMIGFEIILDFPFQHLLLSYGKLDRISVSHTNRSVVAVILLSVPVLCGLERGKLQCVLLAALILMLGQTASQSSQLAFVIAAFFALAFPYRHKMAWDALSTILAVGTFTAPFLAIWMFSAFGQNIGSLPFLGEGAGFGAQRLEVWDFVSRYIVNHPCLGYGMEATRQITDFDNHQRFFEHPMVLHPHNFALQFWIEFGALGAMTVAALIVALLTFLRGMPDAARVALPGFMAVLTISAMGYGMWQGWWLGLVLSAVTFNIVFARLVIARAAIQTGAGLRQ